MASKPQRNRIRWKIEKLPDLLQRKVIQTIQDHPELGYTGSPEFIRESVRDKILQINCINKRTEAHR